MNNGVELRRMVNKVSIGTTDSPVVGSNPRRLALIVTAPPGVEDTRLVSNKKAGAVSTATTGAKLTYTVPAGKYARVDTATFYETTGTTVVAKFEATIGGTTVGIQDFTRQGQIVTPLMLSAGDSVDWNVITAIAASVSDFAIYVTEYFAEGRITLSLDGAAVLDQGININLGMSPLVLLYDHIGQAIREEIRGIASPVAQSVSVIDIFEVGCPCSAKEGY